MKTSGIERKLRRRKLKSRNKSRNIMRVKEEGIHIRRKMHRVYMGQTYVLPGAS